METAPLREDCRGGIDIWRMELTLRNTKRGQDKKQSSMPTVMSLETRVPQTHPLRLIKKPADEALAKLSPIFDAMHAEGGRRGDVTRRHSSASTSPRARWGKPGQSHEVAFFPAA